MQLGFYDSESTLSNTVQTFTSYFLRSTEPGRPMIFFSLAAYDSSCVKYLLHAHRAPHHSLTVGAGFCLQTSCVRKGNSSASISGLVEPVMLNDQPMPAMDSTQEIKLQAYSAETSRKAASDVGLVDIVIGTFPLLLLVHLIAAKKARLLVLVTLFSCSLVAHQGIIQCAA